MTNGALFANMAPRLPEFKTQLGLEAGAYGLLVTAWPVGAIIAGLAAGSLIRRFGSAAVAVFGTLATGLAVLGAGSAGSLALVAAAPALAQEAAAAAQAARFGMRVTGVRTRAAYLAGIATMAVVAVAVAGFAGLWLDLTASAPTVAAGLVFAANLAALFQLTGLLRPADR